MRLNKYIAENTNLSRRKADDAIEKGRVKVNNKTATLHTVLGDSDYVYLDDKPITKHNPISTILLLNKPVGYVCSKDGQGSPTVYDLLPIEYKNFNIAGRLDKDSSGLVLLTNDGDLLYELTHPSKNKLKIYEVTLDKALSNDDKQKIEEGVMLDDGKSTLRLKMLNNDKSWKITMQEGRNRQIRRTFAKLNYEVKTLHRTKLGEYTIKGIQAKKYIEKYNN